MRTVKAYPSFTCPVCRDLVRAGRKAFETELGFLVCSEACVKSPSLGARSAPTISPPDQRKWICPGCRHKGQFPMPADKFCPACGKSVVVELEFSGCGDGWCKGCSICEEYDKRKANETLDLAIARAKPAAEALFLSICDEGRGCHSTLANRPCAICDEKRKKIAIALVNYAGALITEALEKGYT